MCILGHLRRDGSTQRCSCPGCSRASAMELRLCCSSLLRPSLLSSDLGYGRDGCHQANAAHRGPSSATPATHELQARHAFEDFVSQSGSRPRTKSDLKPMTRLEANDLKIQRSRGMNWALWEHLWTATSTLATLREDLISAFGTLVP